MTHFQNELPDAPHLPNASLHENEIIPSAYLGYQLIADRRMTITIANPARQGWRRILFWHPRTIKVPNRHAYIFHGGELIPGLNVRHPPIAPQPTYLNPRIGSE